MSAIESSLRLEIAQYQANLAKAKGEAAKFREQIQEQGRKGSGAVDAIAAAHKRLESAGRRTQQFFAAKSANPWTANAAAASQYAQTVETKVVAAMRHAAAAQEAVASKALRAQFLGGSMGGEFDNNNVLARQAQRSRAAAAPGGRGGGGSGARGMNLGMMSMQFQDIAVQAQMGTRASIILAQQGSQLLSVFGSGGMIAGGVIAIGGAFYTMKEKSLEAFAAAKKEAVAFDQAMSAAAHGGIADMVAGLEKLTTRSQTLHDEMQSAVGVMSAITEMAGGAKMGDKIEFNADQQRKALAHRRELGKQLAESSADETRIAQLRNSGHEDEAEALEREMNLKRELFKISRMDVDGWVKDQLSDDARTKSAVVANPTNTKKDREEAAAIEDRLRASRLKALDPEARLTELAKEQKAVLGRMATEGGLFFEQTVAGLEAWAAAKKKTEDTAGLVNVLKMLEQVKALEEQMSAAAAEQAEARVKRGKDADDKKAEIQGVKDKMAAEQERFAERYKAEQQAKKDLEDQLKLAAAKERGDNDLVARMERELQIREKMREIMNTAHLDEKTARAAAAQLVPETGPLRRSVDEDPDGDGGRERRRGRIRGVQRRRMMTSGLDEFHRNQIRDGTAATAIGADSLSGRRTSSIRARMMGGGLAGFDRQQSTALGADSLSGRRASSIPSRMMGGAEASGHSPLKARHESNAIAESSSASSSDWQSSFMGHLKSDFAPALAGQIATALLS